MLRSNIIIKGVECRILERWPSVEIAGLKDGYDELLKGEYSLLAMPFTDKLSASLAENYQAEMPQVMGTTSSEYFNL
ncbi:hypothetical protein Tco_0659806 [Tanacetum coccineum]